MKQNKFKRSLFPSFIMILVALLMSACVTYSVPNLVEKTDDKKLLLSGMRCTNPDGVNCDFRISENYICTTDASGDLDCKILSDSFKVKAR